MKKFVKAIAATGVLAMLGVAVLPLTTYAATGTATTTVQVTVGQECILGDNQNGASGNSGAAALTISGLTSTTPDGTATSNGTTNDLGVVCNDATWVLSQQIDAGKSVNLMNGATVGFTPFVSSSSPTDASGFDPGTWGMRYTVSSNVLNDTGNGTISGPAGVWHAVPATASPMTIATGSATAGYFITQNFGAKMDGSLPGGTYSSQILYTVTGTP